MKKIVILTSLLTLSACGGGLFWFDDYYGKDKEKEVTATDPQTTTNIINPANENIIKITSLVDGSTDLRDVVLFQNDDDYTQYTFVLDDTGRIDKMVRYDGYQDEVMENYIRQGNTDEFIGDQKNYHYTLKTYGNGNLKYSDFGIFGKITGGTLDVQNTDVLFGGYNSKSIDLKTAVMDTQLFNGSDPVFTGSAVAVIARQDGSGGIIASTDDAEMRFSESGYTLNMPFHSKSTGSDYYDVVVSNSNTNNPIDVTVDFGGGYYGDYRFVSDTGNGFSKQSTIKVAAYGDNNNIIEIVGGVKVDDEEEVTSLEMWGKTSYFEAGFGVKKQ